VSVTAPSGVTVHDVSSTEDMAAAQMKRLNPGSLYAPCSIDMQL
jgi:hypothetical protein